MLLKIKGGHTLFFIISLLMVETVYGIKNADSERVLTYYASKKAPSGWQSFKLFSDSAFASTWVQDTSLFHFNGTYRFINDTLVLNFKGDPRNINGDHIRKYSIHELDVHSWVEDGKLHQLIQIIVI